MLGRLPLPRFAPAVLAVTVLGAAAGGCVGPGRPPLLSDPVRGNAPLSMLAHPAPKGSGDTAADTDTNRAAVVEHARRLLDGAPLEARGYAFAPDAVGFVRAAFWSAGIELLSRAEAESAADPGADAMAMLYRSLAGRRHRDAPKAGDLVFFGDRPGGANDGATPAGVGVVEEIRADGTVIAIGSFAEGPRRVAHNLGEPDTETSATGARINDVLVGEGRFTAGKLWRCYADPF